MKANEFLIWLNGFLTGKDQLTGDEVKVLKKELENVDTTKPIDLNDLVKRDFMPIPNQPMNPYIEPFPTPDSTGCPYPGNCGMPTIWHGVVPPICTKCGKGGGGIPNITCDTTGNLNVKFDYTDKTEVELDTDHITGDLNERID